MSREGFLLGAAIAGLAAALACSPGDEPPADSARPAAAASSPAKTVTPAMIARGREIYQANCTACHGEGGKGDGPGAGVLKPPPRDHTDYAYMSTLTDKEIADVIKMGGAIKGRPLMPSHPQIGGSDMEALVAYIRTLSAPDPPR
jgi:mono/diheme cytochrome c family protein